MKNTTNTIANAKISFARKNLETLTRDELVQRYELAKKDADRARVLDVLKEVVRADARETRRAYAQTIAAGTMENFIMHQFFEVDKVDVDKDGALVFEKKNERLNLTAVEKVRKDENRETFAHDAQYLTVVKAFLNNVILYHGEQLSEDSAKDCKIGRLHYGVDKWGKRREFKFTDENGNPLYTKKYLYDQLDAVYLYILGTGAGKELHPNKAGLNYILMHSARRVKSAHGQTKAETVKGFLDLIMDTVFVRMTDTGYTIDTGVKEKKEKESKAPKSGKSTGKSGKSETAGKVSEVDEKAEVVVAMAADSVVDPMTGKVRADEKTVNAAATVSKVTVPTAEKAAANKTRKAATTGKVSEKMAV